MSTTYKPVGGKNKGYLKPTPGAPSPQATIGLNKEALSRMQQNTYVTANEFNRQRENEFPYIPFAQDSYDDIAAIKDAVARDRSAKNYMVPFEQQDANYLLRKRAAVEMGNFDRWLNQKFDLNDPAQMFMFQQIAPEQFQRRQDVIDYQQNLVSRYAKLRLRGAKNLSDLQFEWMVETGRIQLPKGPIWDPKSWMTEQFMRGANTPELRSEAWGNQYKKGLFSILKNQTLNTSGWVANPENRADIRGLENVSYPSQLVTNYPRDLYDVNMMPRNYGDIGNYSVNDPRYGYDHYPAYDADLAAYRTRANQLAARQPNMGGNAANPIQANEPDDE